MTLDHIATRFYDHGLPIGRVTGLKPAYRRPKRTWLAVKFRPAWAEAMRKLDVRYVEGMFVCTDIAQMCVSLAALWHAQANPATGEPLAVGTLDYIPRDASLNGHGLVVAVTEKDVVVMEPQRAASGLGTCLKERTLSPLEWRSALVRFS